MNIVCLVISTAATLFTHTIWGSVWLSTITFTGFVLTPSVRVQTLHWHHRCWPFTPCHQLLHIDGPRQTTWPRFWVLRPALWDFRGVTFPSVHHPCVHQPELHFATTDEVNIINIFVTLSLCGCHDKRICQQCRRSRCSYSRWQQLQYNHKYILICSWLSLKVYEELIVINGATVWKELCMESSWVVYTIL